MLGRSRGWLLAISALTPLVLFGWMLLWNTRYPETMAPSPRTGSYCIELTLAIAAWPLVLLARARRERDANAVLTGAARGAALGALGGVLVELWCPIANPTHVAYGHILPVLLLGIVGALAGRRYSGTGAI